MRHFQKSFYYLLVSISSLFPVNIWDFFQKFIQNILSKIKLKYSKFHQLMFFHKLFRKTTSVILLEATSRKYNVLRWLSWAQPYFFRSYDKGILPKMVFRIPPKISGICTIFFLNHINLTNYISKHFLTNCIHAILSSKIIAVLIFPESLFIEFLQVFWRRWRILLRVHSDKRFWKCI